MDEIQFFIGQVFAPLALIAAGGAIAAVILIVIVDLFFDLTERGP